ncbi:MAG: TolC family protein [Gammaproteobacteria bacterium]|nr:TolC family protein [Gammaproteobacteria bacterium]
MPLRSRLISRATRRTRCVVCAGVALLAMHSVWAQDAATLTTDVSAPSALSTFAQRILQAHPRVQAAQAELDAARARERGAGRALYNPRLDAEYEDGDLRTRSIGINQTIDLGGKRGARERAASFETQSAMESLALVRQDVLAELLSALGMVDATAEQLQIAGERKALMDRLRALADERQRAGDLSQIELELARLAYAEAALLQAQAAGRQVTATQALARVAGGDLPSYPPLPTTYSGVTLNESAVNAILTDLPSVRVAQARIASAQAVVDLRRRERRPDPTIGVYGGREGDDNLVGIRFSIPFPVRNSYRAEVDAASADLVALDQSTANDYRQLRAELVAAHQRYELARTAWNDWQRIGAGSLTSQTEMLERLWRAGELNTTDYLVQLRQTLDTRVAASEQRGVVWESWIAWLAVSGQVDAWAGFGTAR